MNKELINDYNKQELERLLNKYNLSNEDKSLFLSIILPIFNHKEFQIRMNTNEFPHHGITSLVTHILCNAIFSFLIAKKKKYNIELATKIAMFHDLYELPWQNSDIKHKYFINKHGFMHPLEAAINAYSWFPECFTDSKTNELILDGIIHHMWPFPVLSIDENTSFNNIEKYNNLPKDIKEIIISSSNRKCIVVKNEKISFCKPFSCEGKAIIIADKKVTISSDKLGFYDTIALITGKNKKINNHTKK